MGFLKPKIPKTAPPPNPATPAMNAIDAQNQTGELAPASFSLISTAARGLSRRASTQRASLIGGV